MSKEKAPVARRLHQSHQQQIFTPSIGMISRSCTLNCQIPANQSQYKFSCISEHPLTCLLRMFRQRKEAAFNKLISALYPQRCQQLYWPYALMKCQPDINQTFLKHIKNMKTIAYIKTNIRHTSRSRQSENQSSPTKFKKNQNEQDRILSSKLKNQRNDHNLDYKSTSSKPKQKSKSVVHQNDINNNRSTNEHSFIYVSYRQANGKTHKHTFYTPVKAPAAHHYVTTGNNFSNDNKFSRKNQNSAERANHTIKTTTNPKLINSETQLNQHFKRETISGNNSSTKTAPKTDRRYVQDILLQNSRKTSNVKKDNKNPQEYCNCSSPIANNEFKRSTTTATQRMYMSPQSPSKIIYYCEQDDGLSSKPVEFGYQTNDYSTVIASMIEKKTNINGNNAFPFTNSKNRYSVIPTYKDETLSEQVVRSAKNSLISQLTHTDGMNKHQFYESPRCPKKGKKTIHFEYQQQQIPQSFVFQH